jgi:hypothetical protein
LLKIVYKTDLSQMWMLASYGNVVYLTYFYLFLKVNALCVKIKGMTLSTLMMTYTTVVAATSFMLFDHVVVLMHLELICLRRCDNLLEDIFMFNSQLWFS